MTTKVTSLYDPADPMWKNVPIGHPGDDDDGDWLRRAGWLRWPQDLDACREHLKITHYVGTRFMPIEQWKAGPAWQEAIKHRPELANLWDNEQDDEPATAIPEATAKHTS